MPEAGNRVISSNNTERNGNIGVKIINQHDVGRSRQQMTQPADDR